MENIIFVVIGVLVLAIFAFSISVIHIRTLRDEINIRWYNLVDKLQYRQDLLPLLIETMRKHINDDKFKEKVRLLIEVRARAGKNTKSGMEKMVVEHDLSRKIADLIKIGDSQEDLRHDTIYLEVKKEILDMRADIEKLSSDYNNRVRKHNNVLHRPYNVVPALALRYKKKLIFEFE
ncbi:LemA family protein [Patescibacteria group bacterium]